MQINQGLSFKEVHFHRDACKQTFSVTVTNAIVWQSQRKEAASYSMSFCALCLLIGSAWLMGSPYLTASLCVSLCISVCDVLPTGASSPRRFIALGVTSPLVNGASKTILVGEVFQCAQVIKIRCAHIKHQNRFVFLSKAHMTIKLRLFSRGGLDKVDFIRLEEWKMHLESNIWRMHSWCKLHTFRTLSVLFLVMKLIRDSLSPNLSMGITNDDQ